MKKFATILLLIAMTITLVSCGNSHIDLTDREGFKFFAEIQNGPSPQDITTMEIFGVVSISGGIRIYDTEMNHMDVKSNINFYKVDEKTNEKTYVSYEELIVG